MFVFRFVVLFYILFILCILCFLSFLYCFVHSLFVLSLSYFCTSLLTTAIGWKPNWCNKYHISYRIISYQTQNLSTCNDVSVTWVAVVSWMDLHQPRCRNNHSAIFLWTNLNQHFAYMFTSRHVPATELLHVSAWFSDNSNVIFDISLW